MEAPRITTAHLELRPLPPGVAAALPIDRGAACRELGVQLDGEWPQSELLGLLSGQAGRAPDQARWGIWVIIDRSGGSVIGDIGFHGPPSDGGSVEIGFSIVPSRRRRGHASEAAAALLAWAREQPEVSQVVARCHPDNEASIGTLRRAGLAPVGSSEGMLRWQ